MVSTRSSAQTFYQQAVLNLNMWISLYKNVHTTKLCLLFLLIERVYWNLGLVCLGILFGQNIRGIHIQCVYSIACSSFYKDFGGRPMFAFLLRLRWFFEIRAMLFLLMLPKFCICSLLPKAQYSTIISASFPKAPMRYMSLLWLWGF